MTIPRWYHRTIVDYLPYGHAEVVVSGFRVVEHDLHKLESSLSGARYVVGLVYVGGLAYIYMHCI